MKYKNGEEFLDKLYSNMHREEIVMHTAENKDTKDEKIKKYLTRLENIHNKAKESEYKMNLLKEFYYNKYVIKDLPNDYIESQKKMYLDRGYGHIDIDDSIKQQLLEEVQNEQKNSLDSWIEYLSSDDAIYPIWFKNYVFQGMIKLNQFNKKNMSFGKRTNTTVSPFIELNREVLSQVYNTLSKVIGEDKKLTTEEEQALANGESFKKIYTYYLTKTNVKETSSEIDGRWIKYNQGPAYKPLWESLQGKNTGWCTAGESTCKTQLENGDFYVYYTKDKENNYTNPRIAIRMNGSREIGEIRGVADNQNIEQNMIEIADKKLEEFPDKDKYNKKVSDMKYLTKIYDKVKNNQLLSEDELTFIYEINNKIEGFGYEKDPRIEEIKRTRDNKEDLAIIFKCKKENIATKLIDFDYNDIIVFYGFLEWESDKIPKSFSNLKYIKDADFINLTSAQGLENLQTIGGSADFSSLTSAQGLGNLQTIGEFADFYNLTNAQGLENLQTIGGSVDFNSLTSAQGLENLQNIGDNAIFYSLTNAQGLESLQTIGGFADFHYLTSAQGLGNLQNIGSNAYFNSLTSARGLENLQTIGGSAHFNSLTSFQGLEKLETIGRSAYFANLNDLSILSSDIKENFGINVDSKTL